MRPCARYAIRHRALVLLTVALAMLGPASARAQLDLARAQFEVLPNGLTLVVLEEHSFPSVSVQMLYRVGARDEHYGTTGIAHFLEHMAFRASEHFPATDVVSRIYAAGGEWHGYTWIDQTTYFATVPAAHLDLLLRIERDRLDRLLIEQRFVEPERGAVLAEMHGYENDPASLLHDAVVFSAFQAHPYRNNVIGWESDVAGITRAELVAFYREHYRPANAVLAVVGKADAEGVRARVRELFGDLPGGDPTSLPRTVEPVQTGARRIELAAAAGHEGLQHFEIAWQAPGVNDADFPAFLVLQEMLGGSSGVNFAQSLGASPVRAGTLLHRLKEAGLATNLRTWFPPSAQTYLFSVAGEVAVEETADDEGREAIERAVQEAVESVQAQPLSELALQPARERVAEALVYDVETHEDAAHQLAFFEGLGARPVLLGLEAAVRKVSADELQRVAGEWLAAERRTIGWYGPPQAEVAQARRAAGAEAGKGSASESGTGEGEKAVGARARVPATAAASAGNGAALPGTGGGVDPPVLFRLTGGLPLIVQRSGVSPGVHLRLVLNRADLDGSEAFTADEPAWGLGSLARRSLAQDLDAALAELRRELAKLSPRQGAEEASSDPVERMEAAAAQLLGIGAAPGEPGPGPIVLVIAGAADAAWAEALAEAHFGALAPGQRTGPEPLVLSAQDARVATSSGAQAQLAYLVLAPRPADSAALAWQALQYILSHGYEGRLGREAISHRGLAYYIDSQYRSDGLRAWSLLATGVDRGKLEELEAVFRAEIGRLRTDPPGESEVAEARQHLAGRLVTERQSNEELSAGLAREWAWHERLPDPGRQLDAIGSITRAAVLGEVDAFTLGRYVVVEVGKAGTL